MPHSHHSHSGQFCAHAKSTLAQVLERASHLGFTHFHLSEHVPRQHDSELYPEEVEAALKPSDLRQRFAEYVEEARRLQRQYESQMHVLVGCETENISSPATLDYLISAVLQDSPNTNPGEVGKGKIDYIVGSLHHTNAVPIDFDHETFDKSLSTFSSSSDPPLRQLIDRYLDDQFEVLRRLKPEVVGHFDLFRLFEPATVIEPASIWAKVDRNIRFAVEYGALFECNAAAFRKGWTTSYPAKDLLDRILSLNGRLCLSDDSHGAHAVGLNYLRLRHYLVDSGVESLWYLEKDDGVTQSDTSPPTRFARGTIARQTGPEWATHPFWTNFQHILEREAT